MRRHLHLIAAFVIGLVLASQGSTTRVQANDPNDWYRTGNAIAAGQFLGTTNNFALDFRVNNLRAFRLEPNATSPNIIGGYSGNGVTAGVYAATIGGGGSSGLLNQVTDRYGTVSG